MGLPFGRRMLFRMGAGAASCNAFSSVPSMAAATADFGTGDGMACRASLPVLSDVGERIGSDVVPAPSRHAARTAAVESFSFARCTAPATALKALPPVVNRIAARSVESSKKIGRIEAVFQSRRASRQTGGRPCPFAPGRIRSMSRARDSRAFTVPTGQLQLAAPPLRWSCSPGSKGRPAPGT